VTSAPTIMVQGGEGGSEFKTWSKRMVMMMVMVMVMMMMMMMVMVMVMITGMVMEQGGFQPLEVSSAHVISDRAEPN